MINNNTTTNSDRKQSIKVFLKYVQKIKQRVLIKYIRFMYVKQNSLIKVWVSIHEVLNDPWHLSNFRTTTVTVELPAVELIVILMTCQMTAC